MERIDVAKLLRECPQGMELDCTCADNVVFDKIIEYEQIKCVIGECRDPLILDKYGRLLHICCPKCVIFPKGKTTWKGFQRQFKDGDVLTYMYYDKPTIYIYRKNGCCNTSYYVGYSFTNEQFYKDKTGGLSGDRTDLRLATEEEKQELFKAIKDNGYIWDPETKKLEKLIESKEDRHDEIVMSGIYFDRKNYADEVELHLGNYEIEVRDGKTYAVYKNQETKISKPIFKVGDKIKHKDTVLIIISVQTNSYIVEDEPDNFGILMFSQQDKWELINEPKFKVGDKIKHKCDKNNTVITITGSKHDYYYIQYYNNIKNEYQNEKISFTDQDKYELIIDKFEINNLKPFDKVLVRDGNDGVWINAFFGFYDTVTTKKYPFVASAVHWAQCIPYFGNEHLLGTTDDCDEYFNLIS